MQKMKPKNYGIKVIRSKKYTQVTLVVNIKSKLQCSKNHASLVHLHQFNWVMKSSLWFDEDYENKKSTNSMMESKPHKTADDLQCFTIKLFYKIQTMTAISDVNLIPFQYFFENNRFMLHYVSVKILFHLCRKYNKRELVSFMLTERRPNSKSPWDVVRMLQFMFLKSMPTPFYSVFVSTSVFAALSTVFHSINLSDKPLLSLFFPILFLPYWSFQIIISFYDFIALI